MLVAPSGLGSAALGGSVCFWDGHLSLPSRKFCLLGTLTHSVSPPEGTRGPLPARGLDRKSSFTFSSQGLDDQLYRSRDIALPLEGR